MVTVHRAYGFRFVIFSNDHSPPHVHVVGHEGEARIGLEPLALDWCVGIGTGDMRRLLAEAKRERGSLLEAWRQLHGR